ncbi:MAG: hypothetical protein WC334_07335 [Kiritimatiellales bacterium]|jgi:hypothetical protein
MKNVCLLVFGAVVLWTLPSMAFLPPDAKFRQIEYVQQRVRMRAEYEQQQKDNGKAIVARSIQTKNAMQTPPWMRAGETKMQSGVAVKSSVPAEVSQPQTGAGAEYVQPQKESKQTVVPGSTRMNAVIQKPPRMRSAENKMQSVAVAEPLPADERVSKINHRFLMSGVLLIFLGVAAGWIRYKTRELDK